MAWVDTVIRGNATMTTGTTPGKEIRTDWKRKKYKHCGCLYCTGRENKVRQGQIDARKKRTPSTKSAP